MATLKELENLAYTEYINKDYAYMILQNWDKIFTSLPAERQAKINNQKDKGADPLFYLKKIVKQGKEVIHTKYAFQSNWRHMADYFHKMPPWLLCLVRFVIQLLAIYIMM
jgi:hypothetical protein